MLLKIVKESFIHVLQFSTATILRSFENLINPNKLSDSRLFYPFSTYLAIYTPLHKAIFFLLRKETEEKSNRKVCLLGLSPLNTNTSSSKKPVVELSAGLPSLLTSDCICNDFPLDIYWPSIRISYFGRPLEEIFSRLDVLRQRFLLPFLFISNFEDNNLSALCSATTWEGLLNCCGVRVKCAVVANGIMLIQGCWVR